MICPNCDAVHYFIAEKLIHPESKVSISIYEKSLPKRVREDLSELDTCMNLKLVIASGIMLRRTLEDICHSKDSTLDGDLYNRINTLLKNYQDLRLIAHEIRILGNEMAHIVSKHYDEIKMPEIMIARNFIDTLNHVLFIVPAQIKKLGGSKKTKK
jgi:transcriptional regulator of aromatic amino acid metabolism